MLFSATQTKKTEALTALAVKHEPIYVGVDDHKEQATVDSLEQGWVTYLHVKLVLIKVSSTFLQIISSYDLMLVLKYYIKYLHDR